MLLRFNKYFLIFSIIIYLLFTPKILEGDYTLIHALNTFSLIIFYLIINSFIKKNNAQFKSLKLGLIVFFYSLIFVSIFITISYYYQGDYYVFSLADAEAYDQGAHKMASMPFGKSINYFYKELGETEDLGFYLVASTLYRIIESKLFLNFINIICGVATALAIFRIGKHFMSRKNAFLSALAYSISSYVLWFHSSGLKETIMVMIIVLFFDQYYKYMFSKGTKHIVIAGLMLLSLLLFRPALIFLLIGSTVITYIMSRRKSSASSFFVLIALVLFIFLFTYIQSLSTRFLAGGDTSKMIELKESEGMVKGSLPFTYAVNFIAQAFGPFPTLSPNDKPMLSFFSVGLIFRIFISMAFWFGVYYAFKRKLAILFPLILFTIMEMASLLFILEGLELRKSLPHFSSIYLISFWYFDYFNNDRSLNPSTRKRIKNIIYFSIFIFSFLIIYWNLR
jgi:hypothetical protein